MENKGNNQSVHFRNDIQLSGVFQENEIKSLKGVKWKFQTDGKIYSSPIVFNDTVYIGSEDKHFYAIDKKNGEVKWCFPSGGAIRSAASIANELAYFTCTDGFLYAVQIDSGELLWRFETNGEAMVDPWDYFLSSPIVSEGIVYFGSGDHHIYAVHALTGEEIWRYKTGGVVHATPAIYNQTLFIGSYDGYFYALHIQTGKEKWVFRTVGDKWFPNGDIQGSASVSNGTVYFGSRDFNMYAIDAETGRGEWNYKVPGTWVITTPTVKDGLVFFASSDHSKMFAMDAKSGREKWNLPLHINTFGSSIIAHNTLYFGNMNGKFYALNLHTGEQQWVYQTESSKEGFAKWLDDEGKLGEELNEQLRNAEDIDEYSKVYDTIMSLGSIISTPFIENGSIYFGSTDGCIYALE
ncbi:PQQ-binding-like beta-propeller repeat protein [Bacillus sp. SM2101]|uniref:outer membrane protein assembly factor BamB family protein n=1 Tax=Bacillus sp. SM2101 TaxID=2805366 RepID=UPI001BDF3D86|nr:PQQ-binding-like beta-propeller repeat protein [Bacillus sp. SM2101]